LKSATRIPFGHVHPMIDIQLVGDVERGLSATLPNRRRAEVYIWQLSRSTTQSHKIIRARFERMDDTVWSDATRQELRINTNIRTCIHDDSARKQNLSQQPPLRVVSKGFVGAIKGAVDWKGVFI